MTDDVRPKGTVQVKCSTPGCPWSFWVGCLDPRLPDGPFECPECEERRTGVVVHPKAER